MRQDDRVAGVVAASTGARDRRVFRGLYPVTPDQPDTQRLAADAERVLGAGARLLQYRNKRADRALRREQILALLALCDRHDALLVVNDDWELAIELGADAFHLGRDDADVRVARREAGPAPLIGVSCYASVDRARAAAPYADYLAFGSLFASPTKPAAPSAALSVLGQARELGLPIVGIGGITPANARAAFDAGADAVAVISAVFDAPSPVDAVHAFLQIAREAGRAS
ncbi:MAG: thiamine phosphate synthase [Lautropia sp.]